MSLRSKARRLGRDRWLPIGTLAVATAVLVGGVAWANVSQRDSSDTGVVGPVVMADDLSGVQVTNRPPAQTVAQVMPRLYDLKRQFTVLVLGDSTGAARAGWVPQLAGAMAAKTKRQATLYPWSVEATPNGYQQQWSIAKGSTPPVVVWNGSASGKNISYTRQYLDMLAPMDPKTVDLVIINHSHNEGNGAANRMLTLASNLAGRFPNSAIAVIKQNPERPGSAHADIQDSNVAAIGQTMVGNGYDVIDVNAAYKAMPGWQSAFDTPTGSLHPNQAGYDLWAGVVEKSLGV